MNEHRDDEPAVMHAQLRALTELARAQRLPTLRTELPSITRAVARRRRARTQWIAGVAMMAAAALVLLWSLRERVGWLDTGAPPEQAERSLAPERGGAMVESSSAGGGVARERVQPGPVPEIVAPEPEPEPEPEPTPEPAAPPVHVDEAPRKPVLDAAALARVAEQAMAEQRRGDAIRALTTLVRRFPRSTAARTALLDLGRLLRADGRRDEARCAYQQLVERWPADPMRGEIDRALASLGDGPACRGLVPARE